MSNAIEEIFKEEIDLKVPLLLSVAGASVIIGSVLGGIDWLKWVGLPIAIVGLTKMGTRLYKRIKVYGVNRV